MPHIHTGPDEHDFTVSAFIFRTDGPEPLLLLHNHKRLGKLLQIGGHIELTENPWAAMAHEVLEESGYSLEQLKVLQPEGWLEASTGAIVHPLPSSVNTHQFINDGHRHIDLEYTFVTDEPPGKKVGDGESKSLVWVTHQELLAFSDNDIIPNVREIGDFSFRVVLKRWVPVLASQFKTRES